MPLPVVFFSSEKRCKYTTIGNTRQGFNIKTFPFWQTFYRAKTEKLSVLFSILLIFKHLFLYVKEKVFQNRLSAVI